MVGNALDKVFAKGTKPVSETSKTETGIFCNLINEIGIDVRKEEESAEAYCKRICSKYNLEYSDKVRQKFSERNTRKNSEAIAEKILPFIDGQTKEKIQEHLIKKNLLNRNLYG